MLSPWPAALLQGDWPLFKPPWLFCLALSCQSPVIVSESFQRSVPDACRPEKTCQHQLCTLAARARPGVGLWHQQRGPGDLPTRVSADSARRCNCCDHSVLGAVGIRLIFTASGIILWGTQNPQLLLLLLGCYYVQLEYLMIAVHFADDNFWGWLSASH